MTRRAGLLVTVALVAMLGAVAPVTLATFTASRSTAASFSALSLLPPSGLAAAGGSSATLTWTASSTSQATGYHVLRSATSGSGYAQVKNVTPVTATTTVDVPAAGSWYYVLQTYSGAWASANSNEASAVVSVQQTTSTVGCDPTMQAAETANAGNNNGYELNPGNACASGGGYATDANTGTDNVNSCTDPGKDRHRFWGYAFGLPGTITAVNGVTVTAIVGQSNSGGTSSVCLQLSWDGGTTWTAAKQVPLTGAALTAYTAGSSSDTWGHAWTASQLGSSTFRIRVTDVATTANKDFRLDFLGVAITYTP
ncbi:MAG TPA: hypothetical protein VIH37_12900 [Candidatus Limnocylindrales bacterium]